MSHPQTTLQRWLLLGIALQCSQITKRPVQQTSDVVLFKKYTCRIPSAAWKGKRINTLDTWWTQVKSSSHKFRLTAVSTITWRALRCPQLSSLSLEGRCSRGTTGLEETCLQYCTWASESWNRSRVSQAKHHTKASNLQQHSSLMPSLVKLHAQITQPKSFYQMPGYHVIPLISTGIHSLKCIQEMSWKHAPRSGKNNPRKHKREVTIGEFIAGTAAYQSNDRKSSPNSTEKSCRTNMTSIIVLRI